VSAARLGRGAVIAAAVLAWVVLVVGSCALALTLPVYTSAAEQALGVPATAGLPRADVLQLSGQVRRLVADAQYVPLPSTWRGQPAFDRAAVSHLLDVRAVMSAARIATGVTALLLAVLVVVCILLGDLDLLWTSMKWGAAAVAACVVLAALAAVTNFDSFFAAFHGLFFKAGTWTFASDSLLIRLFPERFWEVSGAIWAGMSLVGSGLLAGAAHLLRSRARGVSASRTADNV
jgi:hypothetical protein